MRLSPADERFLESRIANAIEILMERREAAQPRMRLLYSFEHAADLLDCSVSHVRDLERRGLLSLHKDPDGGRNAAARITGKSLRAYLRRFDEGERTNHRGVRVDGGEIVGPGAAMGLTA